MYPDLFTIPAFKIGSITIGPLTLHSFGLMMGIGFIVASLLLTKELKRKGLDPNLSSTITLLALAFGVSGSKILYLIESWEDFVRAPLQMTFSAGGLTWYGGLILATLVIMWYCRKKNIPFLKICDATAPGMMLAYGIGRIGCHLAGDGDYGVPTNLPWATVYDKGVVPPSIAFRDFPELVQKYGINGVVPDTIPVHPAPMYEFIVAAILFAFLWKMRTRIRPDGRLFMIFLILLGAARFFVEFVRINPRFLFGLSEAQLISVALVVLGFIGIKYFHRQTSMKESPSR